MVLESCGGAPQNEPGTAPRIGVLESYADSQLRSQAMSAVLGWIEDGNFTYDNLDEFVCAVADLYGDFEISEEILLSILLYFPRYFHLFCHLYPYL